MLCENHEFRRQDLGDCGNMQVWAQAWHSVPWARVSKELPALQQQLEAH